MLLSDQDDQHSTDERELISKSYLKCLPSEGSVMVVGSQKRTDQIAAKHEEVTCTTKLRTGTKFKRRSLRPPTSNGLECFLVVAIAQFRQFSLFILFLPTSKTCLHS